MFIAFLLRPIPSAIIALLAYGSWAAFSNISFGQRPALVAFCVQGSFAFVSTISLSLTACGIYRRFHSLTLAFFCCLIITSTLPTLLHLSAGTPNIFWSVLPGLVIGNTYVIVILFNEFKAKTW